MREMGISGISPGPNLSRRNFEHKVFPYLLRDLEIEKANQVWGIDITYVRLLAGWLYMVAVLDLYSRYARELGVGLHIRNELCPIGSQPSPYNSQTRNLEFGSGQPFYERVVCVEIAIRSHRDQHGFKRSCP
jgi:putative transposase